MVGADACCAAGVADRSGDPLASLARPPRLRRERPLGPIEPPMNPSGQGRKQPSHERVGKGAIQTIRRQNRRGGYSFHPTYW